MKNILNLLAIIIVCGTVLFVLFKYCNKPNPDVIIKTDTIYSEVTKTHFKYDTIIKENVQLIHDTIYLNNEILVLDTIFVYLDDYLATKFLIDTAFNDSLGLIVINDSLNRNAIKYRHVERKTYDKTKYVYSEKNGFYIGLGITGFQEPIYNAYLDYKFGKWMFGTGINTENQLLIKVSRKIK